MLLETSTSATCSPPSRAGPGACVLAQAAVTPATQDHYKRAVATFLCYCTALDLPLSCEREIDLAMSAFCDESWMEGYGASQGDTLLAAWCHCFPEFRPGMFPLMMRSLRGWHRLKPAHGRHPMPFEVACAVSCFIGALPEAGLGPALAVLLMFDCYLRPHECLSLRVCDVLKPTTGFPFTTLMIAPWEVGVPSKTRTFDDCVRLDSCDRSDVDHLLLYYLKSRVDVRGSLFNFSHQQLLTWMKQAVDFLHLSPFHFVLYSLRHGGPSADRANNTRTADDVQKRGRWAAMSSTRRYEQPGRLHNVLTRIPTNVWQHCLFCRAHLWSILLEQRPLRRPEPPAAPIVVPEAPVD